ncbi:MAG: TPM domain-containing protein [Cyanobacteriota bacterium]
MLFLTSVGDRRVEIETSTGLLSILPDARVQQIITDYQPSDSAQVCC